MPYGLTRRKVITASVASAVGFGAAGWLVLGPLWTILGVAAGCLIPPVAIGLALEFLAPSPEKLIAKGRPEEALKRVRLLEGEARWMASKTPSFRDIHANQLIVQSAALHALHRDDEALRSADEGVAIYQTLAAEKPAKFLPNLSGAIDTRSRLLAGLGRQAEAIQAIEIAIRMFRNLAIAKPGEFLPALAEALTCMAEWLAEIDKTTEAVTAAHEAADIYWHKMHGLNLPTYAARAALLEGRLLCQQFCYQEAARPLARGWTLATTQQQSDLLRAATPVLRTAYRANPTAFEAVWHAEIGSPLPEWIVL